MSTQLVSICPITVLTTNVIMNAQTFVETAVSAAQETYANNPEKNNNWDCFYTVTLPNKAALDVLFAQDDNTHSGFLIDEGPKERRYETYDEDGEMTSWASDLYSSHNKNGYVKGIGNVVHIGANVEELKKLNNSGEVVRYYPVWALCLINYHRRRSLYFSEQFAKFRPTDSITFNFYLWKPDSQATEYQELYDLFDASSSVDNNKCKAQGIINFVGLKKYLSQKYFVEAKFTTALKHLWKVFYCINKKKYDATEAIMLFRDEIKWCDSLKLNNIFSVNKENPHTGPYFEAVMLATKKYGVGNETLKKVLKSIDAEFGKVNQEACDYWCELFSIDRNVLSKKNQKFSVVDKRNWKTWVFSGSTWLALESRGLHHFRGDYSFTDSVFNQFSELTTEKGRAYQISDKPNQQERYVSIILGYIDKMMNCSFVDAEVKQISESDVEYLGDLCYNDAKKSPDRKYSIMRTTCDEVRD